MGGRPGKAVWAQSAGQPIALTEALRNERATVLDFLRGLDERQWDTPSRASGWLVRDVVAHMGAGCHALFGPAALTMLRSKDIERTNDEFVAARRTWGSREVLAEYERWSQRALRLLATVEHTPLGSVKLPLAELGRFPLRLMLGGALVFDHHLHLRHDVAPALGMEPPSSDGQRMSVVLAWMAAVLANQLDAAKPGWFVAPVALDLVGDGGGRFTFGPPHTAPGMPPAAVITGQVLDFPAWGTTRRSWHDMALTLAGDQDLAHKFLDEMDIV